MNIISTTAYDKIVNLSDEQFSIINALIDEFTRENKRSIDVNNRIGIASGKISCPDNFDDIDFGTEELFGLS
ncbi:MAG: hypothetical protein II969_02720 [Anaerolineaceae bacterium]|nr:hypothetical protein [Anaerolineaceae bacterium]